MDVITDSFDNLSVTELYTKLSQKYAELRKIESQENEESVSISKNKDYFDNSSNVPNNYDEKDFERVLNKFKQTDAQIRSHEQIHASIGPTTSPISYNYQQGPDGKMYAVGGHVRLDTSIPDDPKAAEHKLDQIKKAASGPSDPSGADLNIATQANLNKALMQMRGEDNENIS